MTKRPFAVFDIDGTLIRWQLYHAVADKLVRQGVINEKSFHKVRTSRMNWKTRTSEASFDKYEQQLVALVNDAISGLRVAEVERAYQSVIEEYQDQVYTYTRDIIKRLKAKNYLLFAISGSQIEMIRLLADRYGFDDCGGTVYERRNGAFTGHNTPLRSQRKPAFLKELVKQHNAGLLGSIGVGDSESDIPMLSIVEQPIAFNPTKELFRHARKHSWQIVIERKNMIYELKAGKGNDGSYVVASTNA